MLEQSSLVLVSHSIYPALDCYEATRSQKIITQLLRNELGFKGLVVSDDLMMHAVTGAKSKWEDYILQSISAGCDLLLICKGLKEWKIACDVIRLEAEKKTLLSKIECLNPTNASNALENSSVHAKLAVFRPIYLMRSQKSMEHKQTISTNFIKHRVEEDLRNNKDMKLVTRFPPEPNGYLHIGHAKAVCLNFGMAQNYEDARCNLRFDDTNPSKEKTEYVEAIKEDITWLGFSWDGETKFVSDYFGFLYDSAVTLIKKGLAYVCELSPDEIREQRGTLTEAGKDSPFRNRSVDENLKLFEENEQGKFKKSSCNFPLRAKIDMSSGNINMRDPIIYRV